MAHINGSRALVKALEQEFHMKPQTLIWRAHQILLKDSALKLTLHAPTSILPEPAEASRLKVDHAPGLNITPTPLLLTTDQSAEKTQ